MTVATEAEFDQLRDTYGLPARDTSGRVRGATTATTAVG